MVNLLFTEYKFEVVMMAFLYLCSIIAGIYYIYSVPADRPNAIMLVSSVLGGLVLLYFLYKETLVRQKKKFDRIGFIPEHKRPEFLKKIQESLKY